MKTFYYVYRPQKSRNDPPIRRAFLPTIFALSTDRNQSMCVGPTKLQHGYDNNIIDPRNEEMFLPFGDSSCQLYLRCLPTEISQCTYYNTGMTITSGRMRQMLVNRSRLCRDIGVAQSCSSRCRSTSHGFDVVCKAVNTAHASDSSKETEVRWRQTGSPDNVRSPSPGRGR